MTVVVDASVVIAALVDSGPEGQWAENLLMTDELVAPELLLIECSNVLRRLESRGQISNYEAESSARDLLTLDISLYPFLPLADLVWSLRGSLTSYDATYVALASSLESPLATLDRKLASQGYCKFLQPP